jgi:flagella basal body P-ring formation protein FlgA
VTCDARPIVTHRAFRQLSTTCHQLALLLLPLLILPSGPALAAGDPVERPEPPAAHAAGLPVTLQLREKATVDGHLVRLGQLVVLPEDHPGAAGLQQLVLGPAPADGETQHWGRERISRILDRHGWSEHRYRWLGSKSCQLDCTAASGSATDRKREGSVGAAARANTLSPAVRTASAIPADPSATSVQTAGFSTAGGSVLGPSGSGIASGAAAAGGDLPHRDIDQALTPAELAIHKRQREIAERHLRQAVLAHIEAQAGGPGRWNVDFLVPEAHIARLSDRRSLLDISGGSPPWAGPQRLRLLLDEQGQSRAIDLECRLTPRPWVVTAAGPLRRGRNLEASDLEMRPLEQEVDELESFFFTDVQQALGLRVTQAVTSGQPLRRSHTAPPMVIDRHAGVEVLVRSGLIEITTQGRSLDAGGLGDIIAVEILPQKHRLMARVLDSHRVEVVTGEAVGGEAIRSAAGRTIGARQ